MEFGDGEIVGREEKLDILSERLKKREEDRRSKNEKARAEKETKSADREQADDFNIEFQRMKLDIVFQLQRCPELLSEKAALVKHFDKITQSLQSLHKLVADSQIFLNTYEKRISNTTLSCLQDSLNETQDKFLPKKKFAFKMRKRETEKKATGAQNKGKDETDKACIALLMTNSCGFANKTGEKLAISAEEVRSKDVELHHLKDCTVRIYGTPSTVHIRGLCDCTVMIGPVLTSVFVDDCNTVTFSLACQQLRIHSTSKSDFYTHVTSRSIIEDCKDLRFAPYNWKYDDLSLHFELAAMDPNVNNWKAIDDFNWLALDTPSPNWSVLEGNEIVA